MKSEMGPRCGGHCCREFVLPMPEAEFQAIVSEHLASVFTGVRVRWPTHRGFRDQDTIARMILPIQKDMPPAPGRSPPAAPGRERFTCRHLKGTGDCAIYEKRPQMCRDFPYGKPCEWAQCGWVHGSLGTHPPGLNAVNGRYRRSVAERAEGKLRFVAGMPYYPLVRLRGYQVVVVVSE